MAVTIDGTTGIGAPAATLSTPLAVASGGTNASSTPTAGGVGYGTGTAHAYSAAGTSGQFLTSSGTGAPTWSSLSPTGSLTAVASGSLSTGQTVVLNTDGTVTAVTGTVGAVGTPVQFVSLNGNFTGTVYDVGSGTIVVAYVDNTGGRSFVAAGTVSGNSITFGTPVDFGTNSGVPYSLTSDASNSKVVIAYTQGANANAIVCSISGTTITKGTAVTYSATSANGVSVVSVGSGKVVTFIGASNATNFYVGTISGTSISFGTASSTLSSNNYCGPRALAYDTVNSKVVCTYTKNDNTANSIVGTVSGTTISLGTPVQIQTSSTIQYAPASSASVYDVNSGKMVVGFSLYGISTTIAVGTVSGGTISFGVPATLPSGGCIYLNPSYDSANSRIIFTYDASSSVVYCFGYVSGSTISFTSPVLLASTGAVYNYSSGAYDSVNTKLVATYSNASGTDYAVVAQTEFSNIATKPFVGFSAGAYSGGATATINSVGSADSNQTGLSVGKAQYVQANGSLGVTPAVTATVFAGTSLSATKILVKG